MQLPNWLDSTQAWIEAARQNNSADTIRQLYGDLDTLEVRACQCWPVHFDPKEHYFD